MNRNIENILKVIKKPTLSEAERDRLWNELVGMLPEQPISFWQKSSLLRLLIIKPMVSIFIAIVLIISGSVATVTAANNAKPGDLLYPLDQTVEKIQLKLVSEEKQDKLKIKFVAERIDEAEAVIAENVEFKIKSATDNSTSDTNDDSLTDSATDEDIQAQSAVNNVFSIITDLENELTSKGNIEAANQLELLLNKFQQELTNLPADFKFELEAEGDKVKIEIENRDSGQKFKLKTEDDGRVEVEVESHDANDYINDNEDNNNDDDSDDSNSGSDSQDNDNDDDSSSSMDDDRDDIDVSSSIFKEIKIKVEHGQAEIKVKLLSGDEDEFEIDSTTKAEIYDILAAKYNVTVEIVASIVDIEFED